MPVKKFIESQTEVTKDSEVLQNFNEVYPELSYNQVEDIYFAFLDYLSLHKDNNESFAMMSSGVDAFWHFLILYYPMYLDSLYSICCGRKLTHLSNSESKASKEEVKKLEDKTISKYNNTNTPYPDNIVDLYTINLLLSTQDNLIFDNNSVVDNTEITPSLYDAFDYTPTSESNDIASTVTHHTSTSSCSSSCSSSSHSTSSSSSSSSCSSSSSSCSSSSCGSF